MCYQSQCTYCVCVCTCLCKDHLFYIKTLFMYILHYKLSNVFKQALSMKKTLYKLGITITTTKFYSVCVCVFYPKHLNIACTHSTIYTSPFFIRSAVDYLWCLNTIARYCHLLGTSF